MNLGRTKLIHNYLWKQVLHSKGIQAQVINSVRFSVVNPIKTYGHVRKQENVIISKEKHSTERDSGTGKLSVPCLQLVIAGSRLLIQARVRVHSNQW